MAAVISPVASLEEVMLLPPFPTTVQHLGDSQGRQWNCACVR